MSDNLSINFDNIYSQLSLKKKQLTKENTNNFYLPFTDKKTLDLVFFLQDQLEQYNDFTTFPNTKIAGVYGSFPGLIWNGGRSFYNLDFNDFNSMKNCINNINNHDMICKFTFTNQLLKQEHCLDQQCNQLLNLIAETNNEIVIFSDILENYIRYQYPFINFTSSITKGNTLQVLKDNLQKNYKNVVCFYKRNILQYIEQLSFNDANRIELLLNDEGCAHCSNSIKHFENESYNNLYHTNNQFKCYQTMLGYKSYKDLLNLPLEEQLFYNIKYFQDINIHNYKIRGRCQSINSLISVYINILFLPEIHKDIFNNIYKIL